MRIYRRADRNPRIYLSGGWGYGNRGDNAILQGTLEALHDVLPDAELIITSFSVDEIRSNHGIEAVPSVHAILESGRIPRKALLGLTRLAEASRGRLRRPAALAEHEELIRSCDLVILGGGGYLNDAWKQMLGAQYLLMRMAARVGTPAMLYGQTIGPFSKSEAIVGLKAHLGLLDQVAPRDRQSCDVARVAGVPETRLTLTADQALTIRPMADTASGRDKPVVGLMAQGFRPHEGRFGPSPAGRITRQAYLGELTRTVTSIAEKRDVIFRIIPSTIWDEQFQARLTRAVRDSGVTLELVKNPLVSTYIEACQGVDVMLSTNMHPVILASTADKPSVALSYHFKLDDLMEDSGQADRCYRINDFDPDTVATKTIDLLSDSSYLDHMKPQLNSLRARAALNSQIVASYFA